MGTYVCVLVHGLSLGLQCEEHLCDMDGSSDRNECDSWKKHNLQVLDLEGMTVMYLYRCKCMP